MWKRSRFCADWVLGPPTFYLLLANRNSWYYELFFYIFVSFVKSCIVCNYSTKNVFLLLIIKLKILDIMFLSKALVFPLANTHFKIWRKTFLLVDDKSQFLFWWRGHNHDLHVLSILYFSTICYYFHVSNKYF